jgi:hypothetical protein
MPEAEKTDSSQRLPDPRAGSLIFISHDSRDAELAEAFSKLLNGVSAGVLKSFRSSDRKGAQGIEYGVEWYPQLMSKLDIASDVVCLLTQRSLERPWILYEAGVAKGKLNTPLYGIALGIPLNRASSGPFAQFQNCADGEEELTKLVMQLVRRIPGAEPDTEALQMQVRMFKERIDKVLKTLTSTPEAGGEEPAETSVAKLFEEVKVMFQDLPSRIERRVTEPSRHRRWRRFHPMMLDELTTRLGTSPDDPIGLLVVASMFRDDMPWLYELAMEAYRTAKTGNLRAFEELMMTFQRAVEFTLRGPFLEEWGLSKDYHIVFREILPTLMERFQEGRFRLPKRMKPEPRMADEPKATSLDTSPAKAESTEPDDLGSGLGKGPIR